MVALSFSLGVLMMFFIVLGILSLPSNYGEGFLIGGMLILVLNIFTGLITGTFSWIGCCIGSGSTIGLLILIAFAANGILHIKYRKQKHCKNCILKKCACKKNRDYICTNDLRIGDKVKFIIASTDGKYHIETITGLSNDLHRIDFESGHDSIDGSYIYDIFKLN